MTVILTRTILLVGIAMALSTPVFAQEGQVLTELQNHVADAAKEWQTRVMDAARSLFWILATIEIGIAAVWLALQAASLDSWFAELVRRIMFIGFFAFVLAQGPAFAKAVVDSLFQIGAGEGSASPAEVFDAGIRVASKMSQQAKFGLFDIDGVSIAAALAMAIVVVSFSLVAAIFVSVMVEMYLGLLAGMIMLGLGGSSFTKDFAVRYLVYAFSVGMKLMALVMIARIGSNVLIGLAEAPTSATDALVACLAIAGTSVVVFVISMYVPNIIQGVVQGVSVTAGMETIRHGGQAAMAALGTTFFLGGMAKEGIKAAKGALSEGSSLATAAVKGVGAGLGAGARALGAAAKEKAIGSPGAYAGTMLGLANAKLDESRAKGSRRPTPPERHDKG